MAKVQSDPTSPRHRGRQPAVAGLGLAAICYLAITAAVGFAMGNRIIDSAFFAACYGVFVTGVALLPLLAWRSRPTGPDGRRRPPKVALNAWMFGAYIALHGIMYSLDRGSDGNVIVLALGWGMFCFAGMTCMYFLGQLLWGNDTDADQAAPEPPTLG
ncbi:hypothetical protein [Kitasatospora sp. NPDC056184]|uniref:hypothetical protein n=1 Tax=Kitasatospora sp. NPDC056184 TaxID=3345738 RepID=UPI0035D539B1